MQLDGTPISADCLESPSKSSGVLKAGTIVDSRFEIVGLLGAGGMSLVYRANDKHLGRMVALKTLNQTNAVDEAAVKRFTREAVIVAALNHPNIITVYGFGIWDGVPYLAMELLDGIGLDAVLRRDKRKTFDESKPIFQQILDGLSYAHSKGVVHRDLKPSNVFLTDGESSVKLLDFGIAKFLPESGKTQQKLTQTGELFGTIAYMSPEQCAGMDLDGRTDVYSLGCIMYEVLEGAPLVQATSPIAMLAKHMGEQVATGKHIDKTVMPLLRTALQKDFRQRPTAEAFKAMLDSPTRVKEPAERPLLNPSSPLFKVALRVAVLVPVVAFVLHACFPAMFGIGNKAGANSTNHADAVEKIDPVANSVPTFRQMMNYPGQSSIDSEGRDLTVYRKAQNAEGDVFKQSKYLTQFLKEFPLKENEYSSEYVEALSMLGQCYQRQSKYGEAVPIYTRMLAMLEPHKDTKATQYYQACFSLARVDLYTGSIDKGLAYANELEDHIALIPRSERFIANEMTVDVINTYLKRGDARSLAMAKGWIDRFNAANATAPEIRMCQMKVIEKLRQVYESELARVGK